MLDAMIRQGKRDSCIVQKSRVQVWVCGSMEVR